MSLYGRTDSNANKTKAGVGIGASSQAKTVLYIDETEAALEANKERGLNAPGWWSYFTYTDSSGATRHKAEQLVFIAGGDTNANETQADDATAAVATGTNFDARYRGELGNSIKVISCDSSATGFTDSTSAHIGRDSKFLFLN